MNRVMIDCMRSALPDVMPEIKQLPRGSLVAGYVTGTDDVRWSEADFKDLPEGITGVTIDQAFIGSPVRNAMVIDVENKAWSPTQVDSRMAMATSDRPTVYASITTLMQIGWSEQWRGDVWLVKSSSTEPTTRPAVPPGFNVIAQQWNFTNSNLDVSVVFDSYWPFKPPAIAEVIPVQVVLNPLLSSATVLDVTGCKHLKLLADPGYHHQEPPNIRVGFKDPWVEHTYSPTWDTPVSVAIPPNATEMTVAREDTGSTSITVVLSLQTISARLTA